MSRNICKRRQIVNGKTLIVTVDFGKANFTGYCRCPDGTEVPSFQVYNNGRGFRKFWRIVRDTMREHALQEVVVGFESTGPYGEPLLHFLAKRDVRLVQVNPAHTKKVKQLYDNSPNKTDKKDPKVIADIIELGRFLTVVIPEGTAAELRRLTHARERCLERIKTLYNQLHDLVFLLFPEFFKVMKSLKRQSAHYLLQNYPTPQSIVAVGCEALAKVLRQVSRGHFSRERAEALYQAACESAGLQEGQRGMVMEIKQILTLITTSEAFVAEIEQELANHLVEIPYSRFILSIKGVGVTTVAGLIGEVGNFNKFRTAGELLKYAGLNLYEISSGKQRGRRRISKQGRALMRKLLYFAAINVVRKGGILHAQYQNHLNKGMLKQKALIAIARKLLVIIFALVRTHTPYRVDYSTSMLHKQAA